LGVYLRCNFLSDCRPILNQKKTVIACRQRLFPLR
jgi:hypothetical protein